MEQTLRRLSTESFQTCSAAKRKSNHNTLSVIIEPALSIHYTQVVKQYETFTVLCLLAMKCTFEQACNNQVVKDHHHHHHHHQYFPWISMSEASADRWTCACCRSAEAKES